MTSQRQLLFAYGLAVHLLIVGIVCYAAFSAKAPDEPIRVMYKTAAGKVLFEHHIHTSNYGYGMACNDCHHHPSEDDNNLISCSTCHQTQGEKDSSSTRYCLDCHENEDVEDLEILTSAEAFHQQCIQCHEDIEAGPQECSHCHIM